MTDPLPNKSRVSSNQITGPIPTEIALPLIDLFLWANNITGTLPTELGQSSINRLWVYQNQLSGPLPTELVLLKISMICKRAGQTLSQKTAPEHLFLLRRVIPAQIETTPLQFLWLSNNQFNGTIPAVLASMPSLGSMFASLHPFFFFFFLENFSGC